jgi:hypothetical protein
LPASSKHGNVTPFAHETDYEYIPTPGYYGPDETTLLVEMAGMKVRVKFQFTVLELVHDDTGWPSSPSPPSIGFPRCLGAMCVTYVCVGAHADQMKHFVAGD